MMHQMFDPEVSAVRAELHNMRVGAYMHEAYKCAVEAQKKWDTLPERTREECRAEARKEDTHRFGLCLCGCERKGWIPHGTHVLEECLSDLEEERL